MFFTFSKKTRNMIILKARKVIFHL